MPHNFSWIVAGQLAGMGRPGCGLELAGQMLPYEQHFLSWVMHSSTLTAERQDLARRIGLSGNDPQVIESRLLAMYRKFRDIWPILSRYWEGFGEQSQPVDRFELNTTLLEQDLAFVQQQGVDTIVSLTETPLDEGALAPFNFDVLHMPVPDRHAPTFEQIDACTDFLDEKLSAGRSVMVHCLGGYGRTGTMLVCYLIHCGAKADEALAEMRRVRPRSVETEEQEAAVFAYEERIL